MKALNEKLDRLLEPHLSKLACDPPAGCPESLNRCPQKPCGQAWGRKQVDPHEKVAQ